MPVITDVSGFDASSGTALKLFLCKVFARLSRLSPSVLTIRSGSFKSM
jgi:hypothetical protein